MSIIYIYIYIIYIYIYREREREALENCAAQRRGRRGGRGPFSLL